MARTYDKDAKHMGEVFKRAHQHKGTSFVEIYQNCVIFNDAVFEPTIGKDVKADNVVFLKQGEPLVYGKESQKAITLDGFTPRVQDNPAEAIVHNEQEAASSYGYMLSQLNNPEFPQPMGVFRDVEKPAYEDEMQRQEDEITAKLGEGDLESLLKSGDTWEIT